jgi:hypothetical protein
LQYIEDINGDKRNIQKARWHRALKKILEKWSAFHCYWRVYAVGKEQNST